MSAERGIDARAVSAALAQRIDSLVQWLGLAPAAKINGVFTPLNPTRGDRRPGSFVIYGAGHPRAGGWVEYACPPAPGSRAPSLTGDAMDLCAYVRTGDPRDRKTGYAVGLEFLGWRGEAALDQPHQAKQALALKRDRELAEKNAADLLAQQRRDAFDGWKKDQKIEPGSPVWDYLAARGVALDRFAHRPHALRWRANARLGKDDERRFPAMTALITGPDAAPWGVHRTFVKPDGSGKADVKSPRKIWPPGYWGGAIRLSRGVNKCSPEAAKRDGLCDEILAIGEGVETMLSVAFACGAWRCWAAGNIGAIGACVVPASVDRVVLIGENDESPQARASFDAALKAQASQAKAKGYKLFVTRPPAHSDDFNSALQRLAEQLA